MERTEQYLKGEVAVALLPVADAGRPVPGSAVWDSEPSAAIPSEMAASVLTGAETMAGKALVSRVEAATFALQLSFPTTVVVQAWAQVATLGYSDGEMEVFSAMLLADGGPNDQSGTRGWPDPL